MIWRKRLFTFHKEGSCHFAGLLLRYAVDEWVQRLSNDTRCEGGNKEQSELN